MNIEPLESRIAPASIFVTFTDIDGDVVKITATNALTVAPPLDLNDLTIVPVGVGGQLRSLNITDAGFAGANITFTVTQKPGGDGLAHVGLINAIGVDLGNVTVKGDLGSIDAGDATLTTPAVKILSARSIGAFGTATLGGSLESNFVGSLGALKVSGDVVGAYFSLPNGGIGAITIGGSLVGGAQDHTGAIVASGNIGPVKIGGDVIGGSGSFSGVVQSAAGKVGTVQIGGSLRGGGATATGLLSSLGAMGAVTIGHDILGGAGQQSGIIIANGGLPSVTLGGSLLALPGNDGGVSSAQIFSGGTLGLVKIGHDVRGGAGDDSGLIKANGTLTTVQIGGTVIGGSGQQSGSIHSFTKIGTVTIGGDLRGGRDLFSGSIFTTTGEIGSVTIRGTVQATPLIGNVPDHSAAIVSGTKIGTVRIGGDFYLGEIAAGGTSDITAINIAGWTYYGNIETQGDIGSVKVGRDLRGGAITVGGNLTTLSIGRSFVGETAVFGRVIGDPLPRGLITVGGTLGTTTIGGDIRGGNSSESAYIEADRITSVLIGGSLVAGIDQDAQADLVHNASIRTGHDIGTITVRGSILGNESPNGVARPVISALGKPEGSARANDLALTSLIVSGRVLFTDVLAGYAPDDTPSGGSNGDASIHTIRVGGDWIASSVSAGIQDAAGDGFANGDDYVIPGSTAIVARIASITIGGAVIGTMTNPNDHFGFTAESIGSFKAGLYTAPLTVAKDLPIPLALLTGDVHIREV
jgi:hypothetical protein